MLLRRNKRRPNRPKRTSKLENPGKSLTRESLLKLKISNRRTQLGNRLLKSLLLPRPRNGPPAAQTENRKNPGTNLRNQFASIAKQQFPHPRKGDLLLLLPPTRQHPRRPQYRRRPKIIPPPPSHVQRRLIRRIQGPHDSDPKESSACDWIS